MKDSQRKKTRLVLAMDSQAVQAKQNCGRLYYLGHVEHLVRISPARRLDGEPIAVNTGTLVHQVMNNVNRLKIAATKKRFARLVPKFAVTNATLLECGYRAIRRTKDLTDEEKLFHITKFTQFFAWDSIHGSHYKPLGCEVGFAKVIYEDSDVVFVYEGRIDLVLEANLDEGRNVFTTWLDYKSQGRDSAIYANRNQFLGYSWTLGSNMGFVLTYGLQKEKKDPFKYQPIFHPQSLIEQWKKETIQTFWDVVAKAPLGQAGFPRNRTHCDAGQYGWCKFIKLCDHASAPAVVQNGLRSIFYKKRVWTPWT